MKKLLFSAAALTLLFASCNKTDSAPATENKGNPKVARSGFNQMEHQNEKMRFYFDDGTGRPGTYGCNDKDGNCAPEDVIITAPKIFDLISRLDNNTYTVAILSEYKEQLAQSIPVQYLDQAISGSLSLNMRGDIGASYRCLLFKNNNNEVVYAVPVIK